MSGQLLTDLQRRTLVALADGVARQEGEIKNEIGYHRCLDPTIRSLYFRRLIEHGGSYWDHTITDAGLEHIGLPPRPRPPRLTLILGGAA